jgi:hypothetical protein
MIEKILERQKELKTTYLTDHRFTQFRSQSVENTPNQYNPHWELYKGYKGSPGQDFKAKPN